MTSVASIAVERVLGPTSDLPSAVTQRDELRLTSEQRARAHLRARSEGGRELLISLPRGQEIEDGDVLAIDGNTAVVVVAGDEDVLIVKPVGELQWGIAGYQLGNLHRAARFTDGAILTPYEVATEEALIGLSISCQRMHRPLTGLRVRAAGGHGHDH